jgi:hypothetical protein
MLSVFQNLSRMALRMRQVLQMLLLLVENTTLFLVINSMPVGSSLPSTHGF